MELDETVIPPDKDISQEDSSSSSDQKALSVRDDYTKGCDSLLVKVMISSCAPMDICDNVGFSEFCKKLDRLFRLSSR